MKNGEEKNYSLVKTTVTRCDLRSAVVGLLFVSSMATIIIAVTVCLFYGLGRAFKTHETFGATWQAHDMLVDYLSHSGLRHKWPATWSDLETSFARTNQGYGAPKLSWVQTRISINFSITPVNHLSQVEAEQVPFDAITLADGTVNGETKAANRRIVEFLRSSHQSVDTVSESARQ